MVHDPTLLLTIMCVSSGRYMDVETDAVRTAIQRQMHPQADNKPKRDMAVVHLPCCCRAVVTDQARRVNACCICDCALQRERKATLERVAREMASRYSQYQRYLYKVVAVMAAQVRPVDFVLDTCQFSPARNVQKIHRRGMCFAV